MSKSLRPLGLALVAGLTFCAPAAQAQPKPVLVFAAVVAWGLAR